MVLLVSVLVSQLVSQLDVSHCGIHARLVGAVDRGAWIPDPQRRVMMENLEAYTHVGVKCIQKVQIITIHMT